MREAPWTRLIAGVRRTESYGAALHFPRTGLLLVDHTDVLCELVVEQIVTADEAEVCFMETNGEETRDFSLDAAPSVANNESHKGADAQEKGSCCLSFI